jgi:hypothetical protein
LGETHEEGVKMRKRKPQVDEVFCPPGSIEQQLDMCEEGSLRGEEVLREHRDHPSFAVDLSEEDREGDEMSGDEHSGGLQGGEPELSSPGQLHISTGLPGDQTRLEEEALRQSELAARPKRPWAG